jgi:hypothetical protein
MAISVKISQLISRDVVDSADQIPVARGTETYRIPANQFVIGGQNIGSGPGQIYFDSVTSNGRTLRFRSLSGVDGVVIGTSGNTLVVSASGQNPVKTSLTGNGTTTTFAINGANSINANNYRVDIDGVLQEPLTDYTINGSNIVFNPAPPNSSKVTVVSNNLVRAYDIIPSDGSVTSNKIVDQAVTTNKLALSSVTTNIINNNAVTTDKIADNSITTNKIVDSSVTASKLNGSQTGTAPVYGCRAWVNFDGINTDNLIGTYTRAGNLVTVTAINHRHRVGHVVWLDFTTGLAADGRFTVTNVIDANTFTVNHPTTGTTSGNVTLIRMTIRSSGNVQSVIRLTTADYLLNFTLPMPSANYGVVVGGTGQPNSFNAYYVFLTTTTTDKTVDTVRVLTVVASQNMSDVNAAIFC